MLYIGGMFAAGAIGGVWLEHRNKTRAVKEFEKAVKDKWKILMDSLNNNKVENNIGQRSEILSIFPKHYGFNAIISIPNATNFNDLRQMLPYIEQCFKGEAILELAKDKNGGYLRVHLNDFDISPMDGIKFKWYKSFFKGDKYRNAYGETFSIVNTEDMINPNNDEVVGYRLMVKIPVGLNYSTLSSMKDEISKSIFKCNIKWDKDKNLAVVEMITNPLSDNEKFIPIKPPTPYHMYLAMNYSYEAIMSDLSKNPHLLYTGKSQTGKTVAVITGITNLAYHYGTDDFLLFESMISAKQDLRIFKDLEHCQYYANDIDTSLRLFKYIKNEMYRRNRLFETSKKFIGSMYQWNKAKPKEKLPMILLAVDEMTLYAPTKSDRNNKELLAKKLECVDILVQLLIEGASSGINVLFSLQRPDKDSLSTQIKGQLGTRIGFYQPNTASSLVAMDDEKCTSLELKREAIIKYDKGEELVRTLFLTPEMVEDILKDKMIEDKKHLDIDINGKIVEKDKEIKETEPKTDKKESRFEKMKNKKKERGGF